MRKKIYIGDSLSLIFTTPIPSTGERVKVTDYDIEATIQGITPLYEVLSDYSFRLFLTRDLSERLTEGPAPLILTISQDSLVKSGKNIDLYAVDKAISRPIDGLNETEDLSLVINTGDLAFSFDLSHYSTSPYQYWIESGHTGTQEDFEDYLRQPATDAGEQVIADYLSYKQTIDAEIQQRLTSMGNAVSSANAATLAANNAATNANTKATEASLAASAANTAKNAATSAAQQALSAKGVAEAQAALAQQATTAATQAAQAALAVISPTNAAKVAANAAAVAANTATNNADEATLSLQAVISTAEEVISETQTVTINANASASNANTKALLANEKALYAQQQGDYAKSIGDATKATDASIKAAEVLRVNAEGDINGGRVKAELNRVAAEQARVEVELDRVTAENVRIEAEGDETKGRVKAENDRVTAEQTRVTAEAARNVYEAYDNEKPYVVNNKVSSGGSSYVCISPCTGVVPPNATYWLLIASKGDKGDKGDTGAVATVVQVTGESEDDVMSQKAVSDELLILDLKDAQHSNSIQQIENTLNGININQEALASSEGYGSILLPKNAANGGMSVKLEGLTAGNLLKNGKFNNTDFWNGAGIGTLSASNNIITLVLTGLPSISQSTLTGYLTGNTIIGNKYYFSVNVYPKYNSNCRLGLGLSYPYSDSLIASQWNRRGLVITATGVNDKVDLLSNINTAGYVIGDEIKFKEFIVVNLTTTFGVGNEPDAATCDKMFATHFTSIKHFEAMGRVRSVDSSGLNPTALYLQSPALRSNGTTKDEVNKGVNGYQSVKRVGIATLGNEKITNGTFTGGTTGWTLQSAWAYGSNNVVGTYGIANVNIYQSITAITDADRYVRLTYKVISYNGDGTLRIAGTSIHVNSIFPTNTTIPSTVGTHSVILKTSATGTRTVLGLYLGAGTGGTIVIDDVSVKELVPQDGAISATSTFTELSDGTILYTLATAVTSPIAYAGLLNSNSAGTVYREKVIADAGVYSDKLIIQATGYPISSFEKIIKWENGVEYLLDTATAVIAGDKLSFTHPDLESGDLVMFTYYFSNESTEGKMTLTYYDSRYVIADTANSKFYKWSITSTNGVASITLTEV